jgi:hypothetical protein
MKAGFQSHPTSELLESEGFQTNASLSRWFVAWATSLSYPLCNGRSRVVRGGDERI